MTDSDKSHSDISDRISSDSDSSSVSDDTHINIQQQNQNINTEIVQQTVTEMQTAATSSQNQTTSTSAVAAADIAISSTTTHSEALKSAEAIMSCLFPTRQLVMASADALQPSIFSSFSTENVEALSTSVNKLNRW